MNLRWPCAGADFDGHVDFFLVCGWAPLFCCPGDALGGGEREAVLQRALTAQPLALPTAVISLLYLISERPPKHPNANADQQPANT